MTSLKITRIGSSLGVIIPKEMLARMKLGQGDRLFVTETPDGYALTPYDASIEDELEIGRSFMKDYRDSFRALAK
ncbi:MAG: AbrB/MazE/SpoVT family DNA-binding domain-containing protein [Pseudomonadota bacterium]|nr:AbrB/MazE/SpoVT family DNA-binding domain-containing protein [Pseudomonadota bacterium]